MTGLRLANLIHVQATRPFLSVRTSVAHISIRLVPWNGSDEFLVRSISGYENSRKRLKISTMEGLESMIRHSIQIYYFNFLCAQTVSTSLKTKETPPTMPH